MRRLLVLIVLALVVSSCGGTGGASVAPASTLASATTQAVSTSTTVEASAPAAPDFALELADGSVFTLSAAQKPVYLVFWAEW
jgi:cytochrome oxidase Cu insertion factor (SCO1/SenC/PrrC family)